jgi:hypothetical protein
MNQRNAIPANGMMFGATTTVPELVLSHAPGSNGSAGTEIRSSTNAIASSTENRIPATAAAFGVRRVAVVSVSVLPLGSRRPRARPVTHSPAG